MIDLIKFLPDRVELDRGALNRKGLPPGWRRSRYDGDRVATDTILFKFLVDSYAPIKVLGSLAKDFRPRLWKVEAVLPALLHGHNGRPIRDLFELALAFTRLQFLLHSLAARRDQCRLIPGLGDGNNSYLTYLEASVQIDDPGHRLLIASHMGRQIHQREPNAVYWGQSTRMPTRELHLSFYDKVAKIGKHAVVPTGGDVTRVEAVYKHAQRLATDVAAAIKRPASDELHPLSTLSLEDSYRLLRYAVGGVTGVGSGSEVSTIRSIKHPKARLIASVMGNSISEAHRLDAVLENYKTTEQPCERTFRYVDRALRAYAFNYVAPHAKDLLPQDSAALVNVPVHWSQREIAWETLMRNLGAPDEPDGAILKAWSATRFLMSTPHPGALSYPAVPAPLPFFVQHLKDKS